MNIIIKTENDPSTERVICVNKHIIAFASVTYANKAKSVFEKYGISAEVKRTPGSLFRGCGYSVTVEGRSDRLVKIMEDNGISYRSISSVQSDSK